MYHFVKAKQKSLYLSKLKNVMKPMALKFSINISGTDLQIL